MVLWKGCYMQTSVREVHILYFFFCVNDSTRELWEWRRHLISEEGSPRVSHGNFYLRDFLCRRPLYTCASTLVPVILGAMDVYPMFFQPIKSTFLLTAASTLVLQNSEVYFHWRGDFKIIFIGKRHSIGDIIHEDDSTFPLGRSIFQNPLSVLNEKKT